MRRALAVGVALVVAVGCSSSSPRPSSSLLLDSPGPGYHLSGVSGPLGKRTLESATALPRGAMAAYLGSVRFRRASERVWTAADDGFVTDVVVELANEADAAALPFAAGRVLPGPATRPFGIPRGRGFVQTSDVHGTTMFCVIAFVSAGPRAFVVTRCTPYPQDTSFVTRLVHDQLARA